MLGLLLGIDYERRQLLKKTAPGPLHGFLETPFPDSSTDARKVEYLAVDMETTGLDAAKDAILSIGWVAMRGGEIDLASASHRVLKADRPLTAENIVIHGLTHDQIEAGAPPEQVLTEFLGVLAGKVLIAHHAKIEFHFLKRTLAQLYGGKFLCPVVDTQIIAHRALERRNQPITPNALRLFNLRTQYNLPRYNAHNALSDALCAAELFAAQIAERETGGALPLKGFLARV